MALVDNRLTLLGHSVLWTLPGDLLDNTDEFGGIGYWKDISQFSDYGTRDVVG